MSTVPSVGQQLRSPTAGRSYAVGVAPIRNFLVPQTVQIAWVAGRPFFMVTPWTSLESVLDLHFTQ